jgi:HrpA-like RNA helicase
LGRKMKHEKTGNKEKAAMDAVKRDLQEAGQWDVDLICRVVEFIEIKEAAETEKGAVMIFCPGWGEIGDVVRKLEELDAALGSPKKGAPNVTGSKHNNGYQPTAHGVPKGQSANRQSDRWGGNQLHRFELLRLHSSVPKHEQNRIFKRPGQGMRKIIIATNIAETSITVDDVVHVIDPGFHKTKTYCASTNISALETVRVAKSNVI